MDMCDVEGHLSFMIKRRVIWLLRGRGFSQEQIAYAFNSTQASISRNLSDMRNKQDDEVFSDAYIFDVRPEEWALTRTMYLEKLAKIRARESS